MKCMESYTCKEKDDNEKKTHITSTSLPSLSSTITFSFAYYYFFVLCVCVLVLMASFAFHRVIKYSNIPKGKLACCNSFGGVCLFFSSY